jgi:hypothetical protein
VGNLRRAHESAWKLLKKGNNMNKSIAIAISVVLSSCAVDDDPAAVYNCVSDPVRASAVAQPDIIQPCNPPGATRGQLTLDAAASAARQVGHVMPSGVTATCGATTCGSDFQFDNYSRLSTYCVWSGGEAECHAQYFTRTNLWDAWRQVWSN